MTPLSRTLALLAALLIGLIPHSATLIPAPAPTAAYAAGSVLVGLRPDLPLLPDGGPPLGAAALAGVRATERLFQTPGEPPVYRLRLTPGADVLAAATALRVDPAVAFAEPDYVAVATGAPNDPGYPQQWGMSKIGAEAAWAVTTGAPEIVVAIVDSGLDLDHPDLAGRLWVNPGETAGNGVDDDNNGFVDDIHGWSFIGQGGDLGDVNGHGTQVAGVIGATSGNGRGVAGLCGGCSLMVLKVLRADGTANYSDIAAAIAYAANKGADVINLSLGGASDSAALRAAAAAAAQRSVLVAGAGNDGKSAPFYPAAYDEHVLAVAATGPSDTKVAGSNYGPWVDVAAPGEGIYTTYDGGDYGNSSGTSLGAPFASGLAGLLRSAHPSWTPADMRAQIIRTAANIDAANPALTGQLGGGRINAAAALTTSAAPLLRVAAVHVNGQPGGRPEPGARAELLVTLANNGASLAGAVGVLSGAGVVQAQAEFGALPALGSAAAAQPLVVNIAAGTGYNKPLSFSLRVTGEGGFSAVVPLTITTAPGITDAPATITTQTWTADRVYRVNGEVGVPAGQTLTIQAGTTVRFAENAKLRVLGALIADGTADRPITFTSQEAGRFWAGIVFEDSSADGVPDAGWGYVSGSIVRHAVVEYGSVSSQMAGPYITDNLLRTPAASGYSAPIMTSYAGIQINSNSPVAILRNRVEGAGISLSGYSAGDSLIADNVVRDGTIGGQGNAAVLIVRNNRVERTPGGDPMTMRSVGMSFSGSALITGNLVSGGGISLSPMSMGMGSSAAMTARGNLVTGASDFAIQAEGLSSSYAMTQTVAIRENTLIDNPGNAIRLVGEGALATDLTIVDNNIIAPAAAEGRGLWLTDSFSSPVSLEGNYWGTTDRATIRALIHDGEDKYGVGIADYEPWLAGPAEAAPAFVDQVTVTPDTTLGIQTGRFSVRFSRPMDTAQAPDLSIRDARQGSFENIALPAAAPMFDTIAADAQGTVWGFGYGKLFRYDAAGLKEVPIPAQDGAMMPESPLTMAMGPDGDVWIAMSSSLLRYDGKQWTRYTRCDPGQACSYMMDTRMAVARDGAVWMGSWLQNQDGGQISLVRFADGAWTSYSSSGIDLGGMMNMSGLEVDRSGTVWISLNMGAATSTGANVVRFAGGAWKGYSVTGPSPSSATERTVYDIALDAEGRPWLMMMNALASFDGAAWRTYWNAGVSWGSLAVDARGVKWLTTPGGLMSFDDVTWRTHPRGGYYSSGHALAVDQDGHKWLSYMDATTGGLVVYRDGYDTGVPAGTWQSDGRTFEASMEITALVPRGIKRLQVTGASDSGGMPAAAHSGVAFTVDYAGQVSDRTPPPAPYVFASGAGDPTAVTIQYAAGDGESSVDRVRYAIGSVPEAGDIVSWTEVPASGGAPGSAPTSAALQIKRQGLGLTAGRSYYVSVQARNPGGLWSPVASSAFVAGQATNPRGYIAAMSPGGAAAGGWGFTLTLTGYGFMADSVVLWNGSPRPTTFVSTTQLRATVEAADLAAAGTATVSVRNRAPGGGDSDPASFVIGGADTASGGGKIYLPLVRSR